VFGAALHISPLLAAEKSKVPFFIAGGLLAVWALILSLGLGLRRPQFPGGLGGQRAVIGVSVVLVLAAVSMAVVTAGTPAREGKGTASSTSQAVAPASAPVAPGSSAPAPGSSSSAAPGSSSSAAPAAASQLALAASTSGQLAYDAKQLSAKAGSVTVTFTNASPIEHDVTIAEGAKVLGATPIFVGGSRKLSLRLKPGTYTFYCSVPGHRQAGMEGTLHVS